MPVGFLTLFKIKIQNFYFLFMCLYWVLGVSCIMKDLVP